MKKAVAMAWAEALESGEYTQATGTLRTTVFLDGGKASKQAIATTGFCCLGVLCNLHAIAHPKIAAKQEDPFTYLDADVDLPKEVMKWAGIKTKSGEFYSPDGYSNKRPENLKFDKDGDTMHETDLIGLNDNLEYSFKDIADFVRTHYRKL